IAYSTEFVTVTCPACVIHKKRLVHLHAELLILSESQCENYENKSFVLQEGEAFYFMPDDFEDNPPAGQFTWYKTNTMNNSKIESISFDEKERIHYHGGAIFFLNLLSEDSDVNMMVPCPGPDFSLLQGEHAADLWVENAIKDHEVYNTSGSRWLKIKLPIVNHLSSLRPTKSYGIKLNCSVFCGTNAKRECNASWRINGVPFNGWKQGYSQTKLMIHMLTYKFYLFYFCVSSPESIIPLVIRPVCVLLFCVIVAVLVKCFAIDLTLFFRTFFPVRSHKKDARLYDAYVVYQTQCLDKATEDTQCRFVTQTLPSVLEEKCGYRLFIHGRDDIPGEDHLELVEDSMRQSRRLIVILTPGSGSGSEITAMPQNFMELEGFDWQVGLHHALVQREMSVILIQLGDTGPHGYTHLPIGLQHLIRKSAPLRWPEGSRGAAAMNSRFWKRVRYLMPATPAKKCPQSAIV
uniref:TIR domain-containing protein n=1 Tax=Lates calcarifer TaxID=8187 RepID=A0A4W6DU69_LATCA